MHRLEIRPIFPLWVGDTRGLIDEFIGLGLTVIVVAGDPGRLAPPFAGRRIDARFVADLPDDVDPCDENGSSTASGSTVRASTRPCRSIWRAASARRAMLRADHAALARFVQSPDIPPAGGRGSTSGD